MPMEQNLNIDLDRAERVAVVRPATLRDDMWRPFDVVVDDISITGCRLRCGHDIAVGALISIGVGGAGMRMAKVVRPVEGGLGCAFVTPLSARELRVVTAGPAQAMVIPLSGELPLPANDAGEAAHWSPFARLLAIATGAAMSWGIVAAGGYAMLHASA